jgi:uncharacterized protein (TIGR03382 family)
MTAVPWIFFLAWPLVVMVTWWLGRRRGVSRRRID